MKYKRFENGDSTDSHECLIDELHESLVMRIRRHSQTRDACRAKVEEMHTKHAELRTNFRRASCNNQIKGSTPFKVPLSGTEALELARQRRRNSQAQYYRRVSSNFSSNSSEALGEEPS